MNSEDERILNSQKHLLLQEIYADEPWKMMVCCMMLNQTNRKQVDLIRLEFFRRYKNPCITKESKWEKMSELLKPLGFYNKRSQNIIRFSKEWVDASWKEPIELHGIGKYAQDSWEIFQRGKYNIKVEDKVLTKYIKSKQKSL